ncbi:MFS transporter [Chloroflexota bacterium]
MHSPQKPKVFYGYWIVVATFFCLFIHSGCGIYGFSLFVRPLQAEFGWGRGDIMVALTISFLVMGITSPFVGRLVDRYGARKVITIGTFIAGLGFILLSLMNNLWFFYGIHTIIAIGMAAMGIVAATAVVSNWFKKRRGTAIGIMAAGIGAGGLAIAPLIGGYLIPTFGWKATYIASALLTWILIPLVLLVIKSKPADMGLYPDGVEVPEIADDNKVLPSATEELNLRRAVATPAFWLITVSFLTNGFSQIGIFHNQVPHLEDIGFSAATAATALGVLGLGSLVGKFSFGWLCDQIQAKYVWCISLVLQLAGTIIITILQPTSPLAILWLYAIVMGFGIGGWLPTLSILISTNFGLVSYGTIFGIITFAQSIGAAAGSLTAGYMYDSMGTYHWAFIIFLAFYVVAIPTALVIRRPKSP